MQKSKGMKVIMKIFKATIISLLSLVCLVMLFPAVKVSAAELNSADDTRPDYIIYVNKALNCITIRQQNEDGTLTAVKAMVCSCGREGHGTPEGSFKTSDYYEWCLMVDKTYGRYAVRFNKKILFHSVPYLSASPDALEWEEYNKLGESASLGCVRLSVEDAKWIYDNCKSGTTVVVYSDSKEQLELGKPTAIKIPEDSPCRNWDPTDIDSNNPWLADTYVSIKDAFDHIDYADRYSDLKDAFGYDRDALFNHYFTYGINEGRIANFRGVEGTIDKFDHIDYANRYSDLEAAFGYDRVELYKHYLIFGINEGRIVNFY